MEKETINDKLNILINEYLKSFLAFAIKRTNTASEAEEIAQEIAYQCVTAISKGREIKNLNAFLWSIAHNTYKRWCNSKNQDISFDDNIDFIGQIVDNSESIDASIIRSEEMNLIRKQISFMSNYYRKVMVCYYYKDMNIKDISAELNISTEMVKFYLYKGRQQIKEGYNMCKEYGEKSFNPSDFSVYYSGIDFSKVNIWNVFKRKLPCQIALLCYDKPISISDISVETGTPAVYIEDEINLLIDAGVMIEPVKGKYQTNFFILKKNALEQLLNQFKILMELYTPKVMETFNKYLPEIKQCNIFKYAVKDMRYAWYFANEIPDFDYYVTSTDDNEYPVILSCGARDFIFGAEAKYPTWGAAKTPTYLDKCVVWPCDIIFLGSHHQVNLRSVDKSAALYDIYTGNIDESKQEIYAKLIEEGYVIKQNDKLLCTVAVSTPQSRALFKKIGDELFEFIKPLCKEITDNIMRLVKATLPPQLKEYSHGFTVAEIRFYAGISLFEALYNKGFLIEPEKNDNSPVACYIYEK